MFLSVVKLETITFVNSLISKTKNVKRSGSIPKTTEERFSSRLFENFYAENPSQDVGFSSLASVRRTVEKSPARCKWLRWEMLAEVGRPPRSLLVCERSSFLHEQNRLSAQVEQLHFNHKVAPGLASWMLTEAKQRDQPAASRLAG